MPSTAAADAVRGDGGVPAACGCKPRVRMRRAVPRSCRVGHFHKHVGACAQAALRCRCCNTSGRDLTRAWWGKGDQQASNAASVHLMAAQHVGACRRVRWDATLQRRLTHGNIWLQPAGAVKQYARMQTSRRPRRADCVTTSAPSSA